MTSGQITHPLEKLFKQSFIISFAVDDTNSICFKVLLSSVFNFTHLLFFHNRHEDRQVAFPPRRSLLWPWRRNPTLLACVTWPPRLASAEHRPLGAENTAAPGVREIEVQDNTIQS